MLKDVGKVKNSNVSCFMDQVSEFEFANEYS